jgi:hypothetical protein
MKKQTKRRFAEGGLITDLDHENPILAGIIKVVYIVRPGFRIMEMEIEKRNLLKFPN